MIPYYSGALKFNTAQIDPAKSLGGYPSSTRIPNGGLNNIFPAISREHVVKNIEDVRLIVLKNGSTALTGVVIYTVEGEDALSSYEIAGVAAGVDNCADPIFETIDHTSDLPYQATLASHEGLVNAIAVGNVAANAYIGVWIKRTLKLDQFTELDGAGDIVAISDDALQALLEAQSLDPVFDESQLKVEWT